MTMKVCCIAVGPHLTDYRMLGIVKTDSMCARSNSKAIPDVTADATGRLALRVKVSPGIAVIVCIFLRCAIDLCY